MGTSKAEPKLLTNGLALSLCFSLLAAGEAKAVSFTFTKIAQSSSSFGDVGGGPINDSGTVAFVRGGGLFTSNGNSLTTIVSPDPSVFSGFNGLAINNSGTVAFGAFPLFPSRDSIFIGNGSYLTRIAEVGSFFYAFGFPPSINDSGTVAFGAYYDNGFTDTAIFTSSNGAITTIADTSGPFRFFDQPYPQINNSGTVAIQATLDDENQGIFLSKDGSFTTVADTSGFLAGGFTNLGINNNDTVIFEAGLDNGFEGLFTSDRGLITTIADTSGPFSRFLNNPAINDNGEIVFSAYLDGLPQNVNSHGIFLGPDPVADKVIAVGDSLFGSTVTNLFLSSDGLNNSGQIAFLADLTDSNSNTTRFVLRADPVTQSVPEPSSTLGVLAFGAFSIVSRRLGK
jgi:hypothetical protein